MKPNCIAVPEILLPAPSVDMTAWAVIACDQHTSDAAYWEELDRLVGDKPSTLRLTLPEIYLSETEQRLPQISAAMREISASNRKKSPRTCMRSVGVRPHTCTIPSFIKREGLNV